MELNQSQLEELNEAFKDLWNYDSDDLDEPINPLTYHWPEGDSCLHIAALRGNKRVVEILLDAGLDINEKGDMGNTPLHYAKSHGTPEVVDLLIKRGADVNVVNEFGRKPLED